MTEEAATVEEIAALGFDREQFHCPLCGAVVITLAFPETAVHPETVETAVRDHLLEAHPIRWRLNRATRQAITQGPPARGLFA